MGAGMNRDEEMKVEISRHVLSAAYVLLPLLCGLVVFVLEKRTVSKAFWLTVIASGLALVGSAFMGGRAISLLRRGIPSRFSLFNLQAVLCLIGFGLLVMTYFLAGDPLPESQVLVISKRVASIEGRLNQLDLETQRALEELNKLNRAQGATDARLTTLEGTISSVERDVQDLRSDAGRQPRRH